MGVGNAINIQGGLVAWRMTNIIGGYSVQFNPVKQVVGNIMGKNSLFKFEY